MYSMSILIRRLATGDYLRDTCDIDILPSRRGKHEQVNCMMKKILGVVEADFLTPTANKQEFDTSLNTYTKFKVKLVEYLNKYYYEVQDIETGAPFAHVWILPVACMHTPGALIFDCTNFLFTTFFATEVGILSPFQPTDPSSHGKGRGMPSHHACVQAVSSATVQIR